MEKYIEDYKKILYLHINKIQVLPEYQVFEILYALNYNLILWSDIPPEFSEKFDIPHIRDYGVDLIDLEYTQTGQVKLYNKISTITWSDFSKFYCYSKGILNIKNLYLFTTEDAKIDNMCLNCIKKDKINLIRNNYNFLLNNIDLKNIKIENDDDNEDQNNFIEQRDYLIECSELFRSSENDLLKFQLPCGVGKSYIIMDIIKKDLEISNDSKYIIFCPWIDLGKQIFELAQKLNIKTSLIGEGRKVYNKENNLIVCINASVDHIPKRIKFKYKFIDEAHHCESEDNKIISDKIFKIPSEKTLMLSATFKKNSDLDYEMNLRDAIDLNYLSDYVLNIEYFTKGDRTEALLNIIKNNLTWTPIFIYFNTTEKAIIFSEKLKELGINSEYLIGEDNKTKREKIIKDVKNYKLSILCLCGVFNEGISINNIKTVIFGDLRHSNINRIQVSMRASRKHHKKSFFRIVVPIIEEDFKEIDINKLVQTFLLIDPKLEDSIKNKRYSRLRIRTNNLNNILNENDELIAEHLREEIYDRLGNMIKGYTQLDYAKDILKRALERQENGKNLLPRQIQKNNRNTDELIQEYKDSLKLSDWKKALKGKGTSKCSDEVRDYLDQNLVGWRDKIDFDKKAIKDAKEIVKRALDRQENGKNLLPRKIQKKNNRNTDELIQEDRDATKLQHWKQGLKGKGRSKCSDEVRDHLDQNLVGWRDELDFDKKAMKDAKDIVKRALERQANGKNLLPRFIRNKNTDELIQEYKDATKLGTWKQALKGKGTWKCSDKVKKYLDKNLVGWRKKENESIMSENESILSDNISEDDNDNLSEDDDDNISEDD